jgi:hypothetical protein
MYRFKRLNAGKNSNIKKVTNNKYCIQLILLFEYFIARNAQKDKNMKTTINVSSMHIQEKKDGTMPLLRLKRIVIWNKKSNASTLNKIFQKLNWAFLKL